MKTVLWLLLTVDVTSGIVLGQTAGNDPEHSDVKAHAKAKVEAEVTAKEKAREKAAAMQGERPDEGWQPTEVTYYVFVVDVDDINGSEQNFTVNVYLQLQWKDIRLANPNQPLRRLPLKSVWNPRILIANQQALVRKSLPEVVEVESNGTVTYRQRYVGPLSQPLRLSEFPMDQHWFTIQFAAPGYSPEDIKFIPGLLRTPNKPGGDIAKEFSLADWKILGFKVNAQPYYPAGPEASSVAGFAFQFEARRYVLYYLWQVVVPLILIVMMSWAAFWIDSSNAGAQIGLATSSMLTLIAYRFLLGNLLPRLPYMTRMDYFTLGSTILVFLALVEVLVTVGLVRVEKARAAKWIDRASRISFPILFVVLFLKSLFF